jgi:predicted adenine nucleotide alpha hydrolase (AANH) superfamily ATPase
MKRMLVHMCCGPCSVWPLKKLLEGNIEVWGFFYNPNIHPREEFLKRLEAAKLLASYMGIKAVFVEEGSPYAPPSLPSPRRCIGCYRLRLEKTAETAKNMGFEFFSTSLLYSRRQSHEAAAAIGFDTAGKYGISFYYEDFRAGWRRGIEESRRLRLYRQKYCGCEMSRMESNAERARIRR